MSPGPRIDAEKLRAMTLEELRRLAAEHGIPRASRLGRDTLIKRLQELPAAPPVEPARPAEAARERRPTERRAPGEAGVPSTVLPDRPPENEPEVMARLYLEQGHPERAADIYRELLALEPDDARLRARLAAAEALIRAGAPEPEPPRAPEVPPPEPRHPVEHCPIAAPPEHRSREPMGMLDFEELPDAYGVDECELLAKDPFHVFAYWEVTEAGIDAARARIGEEAAQARLVMRVVATHVPGEPGPERESRDFSLEGWRGRRYLPVPRPGMRLRVACGLVTPSGLFVPITHSTQLKVPPAEPATEVSTEWMEVLPDRSAGLRLEPITMRPRRGADERGVVEGTGPGWEEGGQPHPTSPVGGFRGGERTGWKGPGSGGSGSGRR
jgi:hypothetical protein